MFGAAPRTGHGATLDRLQRSEGIGVYQMDTIIVALHMIIDLMTGGDPTLPSGHPELITFAQTLAAIRDYLLAILIDGDYLNDWLTHLPTTIQPIMLVIGKLLAIITGR